MSFLTAQETEKAKNEKSIWIIEKAENFIKDMETQRNELQKQIENLKVQVDTQVNESERDNIKSQEELEKKLEEISELKGENETMKKITEEQKTKLVESEQSKSHMQSELEDLQERYSTLLSKTELLKEENSRLDSEKAGYSKRFIDLNDSYIEVKKKLTEIDMSNTQSGSDTIMLDTQIEILNQTNSNINSELKKKCDELISYKKDINDKTIDLTHQLEMTNHENVKLKETQKVQETQISELEKKLIDKSRETADMEQVTLVRENSFQTELSIKDRKIQLLENKLQEIERNRNRIIAEFDESNEQLSRLLELKNSCEKDYMAEIDTLHQKIQTLEANNSLLLPSVSTIPLSVSESSSLVTEGTNFTVSEILSKCHEQEKIAEEYKLQVEERDRYIQDINLAIEKKIPLITAQNQDYNRAIIDKDNSQRQHREIYKQLSEERRKNEELKNDYQLLQDQCQTKEIVLSDLQKQICCLLKQTIPENNNLPSDTLVMPNTLILYGTVEELQSQNTQLLTTINELNIKYTQQCDKTKKEQESEMTTKIQGLMSQLDNITKDRESQQKMMETIVQQRDLYRTLYKKSIQNVNSTTPTEVTVYQTNQTRESTDEVEELKKKVTEAENELEVIREEYKKTNDQILEDCDKFKSDYYSIKLEKDKLLSEHNCAEAKYRLLEQVNTQLKTEIVDHQKKYSEYQTSLFEHQKLLAEIRNDLERKSQELLETKNECGQLKAQNDILQKKLETSRNDLQKYTLSPQQQLLLIDNIKQFETDLRKRDTDENKRLIAERETLLEQISVLKESNNKEVSSYKSQISKWRLDCEELNSKISQSNHKIMELESEIENIKSSTSVTDTVDLLSGPSSLPAVSKDTELNKLKSTLTLTQRQSNEYKLLLNNSETQLQQLIQRSEQFKLDSETRIHNLETENATLQNEVSSQTALVQNNHLETEKLKQELLAKQTELSNNQQRFDDNNKRMAEMVLENTIKIQEAAKSKDDYTTELQNHSSDIHSLKEAHQHIEQLKTEKELLSKKIATLAAELVQKSTSHNTEKQQYNDDINDQLSRIKLLEHQNELLLSQINSFNIELSSLKLNTSTNSQIGLSNVSQTNNPLTLTASKEVNDLRELLVFTSREKDIIQTDLTTCKQKLLRFEQEMKDANQKINLLSEENQQFRIRESKAKSDESHAHLLAEIQKNNDLKEQMAKLQEEKDNFKLQLDEKTNRIKVLVGKFKKLQTNNQQLESEKTTLQTENTNFKTQVDDLTKSITQKIDLSKYDTLLRQHQQVQQENTKLSQELSQLTKSYESKEIELNTMTNDKDSILAVKNKLRSAFDNLHKQFDENTKLHEQEIKHYQQIISDEKNRVEQTETIQPEQLKTIPALSIPEILNQPPTETDTVPTLSLSVPVESEQSQNEVNSILEDSSNNTLIPSPLAQGIVLNEQNGNKPLPETAVTLQPSPTEEKAVPKLSLINKVLALSHNKPTLIPTEIIDKPTKRPSIATDEGGSNDLVLNPQKKAKNSFPVSQPPSLQTVNLPTQSVSLQSTNPFVSNPLSQMKPSESIFKQTPFPSLANPIGTNIFPNTQPFASNSFSSFSQNTFATKDPNVFQASYPFGITPLAQKQSSFPSVDPSPPIEKVASEPEILNSPPQIDTNTNLLNSDEEETVEDEPVKDEPVEDEPVEDDPLADEATDTILETNEPEDSENETNTPITDGIQPDSIADYINEKTLTQFFQDKYPRMLKNVETFMTMTNKQIEAKIRHRYGNSIVEEYFSKFK